jgi:hypothetical protein
LADVDDEGIRWSFVAAGPCAWMPPWPGIEAAQHSSTLADEDLFFPNVGFCCGQ